jgi:hypothetical protein
LIALAAMLTTLARILLLLTRLLLAAALLLAGLLTRVLVLLARVLILIAHSGSPLLNVARTNPATWHWLLWEQRFRRGFNVAADCRAGDAGTGFGNNLVQADRMSSGAVAAPGSHVRKPKRHGVQGCQGARAASC